jgi:Holliday junction resolvase RusA-like endonuclease
MPVINIRALSVNKCWQGRRFKTPTYKAYEQELIYQLPKIEIPRGKKSLLVKVGFSSKLSDIDNIAKPLIDILQKKYFFDDKDIYYLEIIKEDVKKGEEYIAFEINPY